MYINSAIYIVILINGFKWSFTGNSQIVFFKPFESISRIIIIDHSADFNWVIPKIAESPWMVVWLFVIFMCFVPQISCKKGEYFANVSRVWVNEHKWC